MRAMRFFLGFAASSAFVGAIAAGCGSSSSPTQPQDSGPGDVTMEAMPQPEAAPPEAAPDVMEAAADVACVPDANITMLPVPDASIGDSGATAAGCFSCIEAACPTLIAQCNQSCACVAAFEMFDLCLAQGGGLLTCVGSNFTNIPGISVSSFICAAGCATPSTCGYSIPLGDGGGEGGGGDSGGDTGGGG